MMLIMPNLSSVLAFVAPVLALSVCPLGKKKEKTEADVCKHILTLAKEEGKPLKGSETQEKCVQDFGKALSRCTNRKEIITCMINASKVDDAEPCMKQCKEPGSGTGTGSGSSAKTKCINACVAKHGPLLDLNKTKECGKKYPSSTHAAQRKACLDSAMNSATSSCAKGCRNK